MPPNPPSNAHGFAMRSMSLRDMQIPKSEKKKFLAPHPPKSWVRPCIQWYTFNDKNQMWDPMLYLKLVEVPIIITESWILDIADKAMPQ